MIFNEDAKSFKNSIAHKAGFILGIDYGLKKIGLSISDETGSFAFPYGVLKTESSMTKIAEILESQNIKAMVVGIPKKNHSFHPTITNIIPFVDHFCNMVDILLWDERMSSIGSVKQLNYSHGFKKEKLKKNNLKLKQDDHYAAQYILQSALETMNS